LLQLQPVLCILEHIARHHNTIHELRKILSYLKQKKPKLIFLSNKLPTVNHAFTNEQIHSTQYTYSCNCYSEKLWR
jgi:two-component SAPR family response regulator